jgi:hypothetical protein
MREDAREVGPSWLIAPGSWVRLFGGEAEFSNGHDGHGDTWANDSAVHDSGGDGDGH